MNYLTINTGHAASSATLSLTLPKKNSLMPPSPRLPMIIMSKFPFSAVSIILSDGLPSTSFVETFNLGLIFLAFLRACESTFLWPALNPFV